MTTRQQLARLLPLVVLVLLTIVGLRASVAGPSWDGPLKAYGVVIGLVLEAVFGTLLVITLYRERAARRQHQEDLAARSASRRSSMTRAAEGAGDDDERDVAGNLRFLLRLALGSAMAAVAVVLLLNLHLHLFTGKPRRLPVIHLPTPTASATPFSASHGGGLVHVPLTAILYSLLVVALLVTLALSLWWARGLRKAIPAPGDLYEITDDEEGLREAVASGRAAMADLDDARAAIIACYVAMEASLGERGAARGVADTPSELLSRARDRGIVRGGAARQLTTLFYEARFSSHPLGGVQRAAAVAALDELAAELGDVVPGAGS